MKVALKTIVFIIAWTLSFCCANALLHGTMSTYSLIMNAFGFILGILWLYGSVMD